MAQIKRMEIGLNKNFFIASIESMLIKSPLSVLFYLTTLLPRYCVIANYCMLLSPSCVRFFFFEWNIMSKKVVNLCTSTYVHVLHIQTDLGRREKEEQFYNTKFN